MVLSQTILVVVRVPPADSASSVEEAEGASSKGAEPAVEEVVEAVVVLDAPPTAEPSSSSPLDCCIIEPMDVSAMVR